MTEIETQSDEPAAKPRKPPRRRSPRRPKKDAEQAAASAAEPTAESANGASVEGNGVRGEKKGRRKATAKKAEGEAEQTATAETGTDQEAPSSESGSRKPRRRRRSSNRNRNRQNTKRLGLHQRTSNHFRPDDRQRGAKYFMQDRVQLDITDSRARALVTGTERDAYAVGLDWSQIEAERAVHAYCQCERFAGGTPCKHVWATLLHISSKHADQQPDGKDRIGLRRDNSDDWAEFEALLPTNGSAATVTGRPNAVTVTRNSRRLQRQRRRRRGGGTVTWRSQLDGVLDQIDRLHDQLDPEERITPRHLDDLEVLFLINAATSRQNHGLEIDLFGRRMTPEGKPAKLKRVQLDADALERLLGPYEVEGRRRLRAVPFIAGLTQEQPKRQQRGRGRGGKGKGKSKAKSSGGGLQRLRMDEGQYEALTELCERGLLHWWDGRAVGEPQRLDWDNGPAWRLALHLEFAAAKRLRLRAVLERPLPEEAAAEGVHSEGDVEVESVPLSRAVLVLPGMPDTLASSEVPDDPFTDLSTAPTRGLVVFSDAMAPLELVAGRDMAWIELLAESGELMIPDSDLEEAVTTLLEMPELPRLEAPEDLQLSQESLEPIPRLKLEPEDTPEWMNPQLVASLSFVYGSTQIDAGDPRAAVVDWDERSFVRRDLEQERSLLVSLLELGFKPLAGGKADGLELDPKDLPRVAEPLLMNGWEVEAHGINIHPPKPPALKVESNLDWFELSGQVEFAGDQVEFAKILAAIAEGRRTVELEDGSKGLLPESWMETYDSLAKLAHESTEEGLRFLPSQALLVDALMAAMPPVNVDKEFAQLRSKLRSFESITPKKEPRAFGGKLRGYQQMGLGWLIFLREFGLGGVLADDMGLGKTVQTLALLAKFRTAGRTSGKPYLVVAPRSLVYNWLNEAERFTPSFKTVEYSGPDREKLRKTLGKKDLVITTYGTLRRDISYLATVDFDTVILDEAQAIKNPESQTAKACRLLNAGHRLALTGTPIENHLGELGSIFEFLNPGLLGKLPALEALSTGRQAGKEELELISQGIRPFILRRTKTEVLPDLPEKTEQVLRCDLNEQQRELYDQLRITYRENLLQQVEAKGVGSSAMQVLEALLRLRQIACHPGLVNDDWNDAGSAKLESLFERVQAVREEGHKVVIFSQFTKLLAKVRAQLDDLGTRYAYLDGSTKDRGAVVDEFQTDDDCNLFLISLKAGGVGLNLTAASYVFLLDPWWNPAVEAQAIDRAHRIGQTQPVFAYRMIARDTVEEKMLELQQSKRELAEAILDGEGQSLRDLTADDLSLLLS